MRILFVSEFFPPYRGGIEVVNLALATELATRGHEVTVLTSRHPSRETQTMPPGIRVLAFSSPLRALFPCLALLHGMGAARQADVIHTNPYSGALGGWLLSVFTRTPRLLHLHGFLGTSLLGGDYHPLLAQGVYWYERLILSLPWPHVLCVSHSLKERVATLLPHATVLHNGIDPYVFTPGEGTLRRSLELPDDAIVLTYGGRRSPLKGYHLIEKALPDLLALDPRIHMVLCGTESIPDHPRVHGIPPQPHKDMAGIFRDTDLLLHPSINEGYCLQIVEAARCGSAILCPRTTSYPEVSEGRVVWLEEQSSRGIITGVEAYLCGRWEEREQKATSWSEITENLLLVYQDMLGDDLESPSE